MWMSIASAQEKTFEKEVNKISKRIEKITKQQKDSLKEKVVNIEKDFSKGKISKEKADDLKKEAAIYHANRIETLVSQQERLLQLLVQDKTNGKIASSNDFENNTSFDDENTFTVGNKTFKFSVSEDDNYNDDQNKNSKDKWSYKNHRRTTSQFVFAMGINNVLVDDKFSSLNDSDYQIGRSHFYELGWTWKTRFSPKPSKLYIKYGFSFLWNNLRLEGNRIHLKNGDLTEIADFEYPLSESRLRHVQMIFPLHFELDFSDNKVYSDGRVRDRTSKSLRIGFGGFAGFKLGTRQYLEYLDEDNIKVKETQYDNLNMNIFNYGISSYVGYKDVSVYLKYDLNELFQNSNRRNISMGIRLDLD